MKTLILGGNRFVGKLLADDLLNISSNEVTVFNRKGTGLPGCNIIKGDRNNIEDLELIDFNSYDQIVDMCLYKPEQFKLIEPYLPINAKYIFISSGAAYKDIDCWPIDESNPLGGMEAYGDYGCEKALVEELIKNSNLKKYTILRPTYVVGIGNHNPRLGHYINCLLSNTPIEVAGDGENIINIVFAEDLVKSIIKSFGSTLSESYNICNDEYWTVNSLIKTIADTLQVKDYKINHNSNNAILPSNHYGIFSNDKAKHMLKIRFCKLKDSLSEYINWYKLNF